MNLENENNQFDSDPIVYEKVVFNIMLTSSCLNKKQSDALKPFGLTVQQYNILRILKNFEGKSASVKLLTEHMVDKMSNASRLVDKLISKKLVSKVESFNDRRMVDVKVTKKGLEILDVASKSLTHSISKNTTALSEMEVLQLSDLLDRLRAE
jgi:DNA-binding MarR family transcriptional regulator